MANILPAQNAQDVRLSSIDIPTDETRQSTTTLSATSLVLPLAANESRLVLGTLGIISNSTAKIKLNLDVPAGASGYQIGRTVDGQASAALGTGVTVQTNAGGTAETLHFHAMVKNGATAGNMTLQAAQGTSNAVVTTIYAGSGMVSFKVS